MSSRTFAAVVAAIGAAFVVGACGSQSGSSGGGGGDTIKLYYSSPTAEFSLPQIALDNHLYPSGCSVQVSGGNTTVGLSLLSSGRVQAYVNSSPVPEQVGSGGSPVQWAALWQKGITTDFIARPGINSLSDLQGKSIGIVEPKLTLSVLADSALRNAGVDPSSVKSVTLGTLPAVNSAFAAGTVDAIVTNSASAVALKTKVPGTKTLVDFSKNFPWVGAGVVVNTEWAKSHRGAVVCLLTGLNRALELARSKPDRVRPTLARVTKLSGSALDFAVQTVHTKLTAHLEPVPLNDELAVMKAMKAEGENWATASFGKKMVGDPSYATEAVNGK